MADTAAEVRIGPQDHGRRMSLAEFRDIPVVEGYRYELSRGVIEVAPIPGLTHGLTIQELDFQLVPYIAAHRNVVRYYGGGDQAKMEMPLFDSERHPDRSLYTTPPPPGEQPWDRWTPTIVIEVVSPGARNNQRDYVEKREEYRDAAVLEYWIIDPQTRAALMLTRHGDAWREHKLPSDGQWTTHLLPGFTLDLKPVFAVLDD